MRYELVGVSVPWQHNNEMCGCVAADGSGDCVDDFELGDSDGEFVCWRSVDFSDLKTRFVNAVSELGWVNSVYVADWGIGFADDCCVPDDDVLVECATAAFVEKFGCAPSVDVIARVVDCHKGAADRYVSDRVSSIKRIDGRVYSSVTSLPRWLRRTLVRFSGEAESVDVSACYLWLLSAEHRLSLVRRGLDTTEVDTLMNLIESGEAYRKLAEMAELPHETALEMRWVKRDFQTFCLFGTIGWHPLWHALMSICPGVCDDIQWWRRQRGGATRLAHFLQRAEGQLMTDGLVRWLASHDIPSVQIHDGAIVSTGVSSIAAEWLQLYSRELYGRSCRVKCEVL